MFFVARGCSCSMVMRSGVCVRFSVRSVYFYCVCGVLLIVRI